MFRLLSTGEGFYFEKHPPRPAREPSIMSDPNMFDSNMSDPHMSLEVLGVHGGHGHGAEEGKEYLWKVLGVIAGIYGFFLLEKLFSVLVPSHGHVRVPCAFYTPEGQVVHTKGLCNPWGPQKPFALVKVKTMRKACFINDFRFIYNRQVVEEPLYYNQLYDTSPA